MNDNNNRTGSLDRPGGGVSDADELLRSTRAPGTGECEVERGRMAGSFGFGVSTWLIGPPVGDTSRRPGELYEPITESLIRRVTDDWNKYYWQQLTRERELGGPVWTVD